MQQLARPSELSGRLINLVNKLDRSSRVDVSSLERRIDFADGLGEEQGAALVDPMTCFMVAAVLGRGGLAL